jgi:hypothetical protein
VGYDAEGRLLRLETNGWRVAASLAEDEPTHALELEAALRKFLRATGESVADDPASDLNCLVNACRKFIASPRLSDLLKGIWHNIANTLCNKSRTPKTLLFAILLSLSILGQSACRKFDSSVGSGPTASPSQGQTEIVDQILDKYADAVGGPAAIDRITSYNATGTFETSLFREKGAFEVWGKEPGKSLSVITFPRIGTLKKGFDGENRWVQTPAGTLSDESPKQMAQVERDADVYRAGKIKTLYQSMRLEGKARLNGRDAYVVEGEPVKGPTEKLFFDTDSGLLLRWDMVRRNPQRGNIFVKVHLDDYRDVDGLKVPFSMRYAFESFDLTFKVDDLKHNVPIDDALFKKPTTRR